MKLTHPMTALIALSACAIAENPMAASANVTPTLEPAVEMQVPDSIVQLENATVQSIAQPETVLQTPEVLTAASPAPAEPMVEPMAEPIAEPVELPMLSQTPELRTTDSRSMSISPIAPRIEVGTQGIPPVTDLPDRVSLPSPSLLPMNFENPIILRQAIDSTLTTTSRISDAMPDPVWSRRMEDLTAYKAAYSENLLAWSGRVAQCMSQKPKLYVLRSDGKQPPSYSEVDGVRLPVYFNGEEGTVVQNKDGVSVCGM